MILQCSLCGTEATQGKVYKIWTGEQVGTRHEAGQVQRRYGRFQAHEYVACSRCLEKRWRAVVWTAVAHVALLGVLTIVLTPAFRQEGTPPGMELMVAAVFSLLLTTLPALVSVLLFRAWSPFSRLKRLARREHQAQRSASTAGGVNRTRLEAFSEREYRKLKR